MSLHIGKALNLNDLEEGDDVYFECSIQVFIMTVIMLVIMLMINVIIVCTPQICQLVYYLSFQNDSVDFHDEYLYFVGVYLFACRAR